MIGQGHDHGIDIFVLQHSAQVRFDPRFLPPGFGEQLLSYRMEAFIDIAQVSNVKVLEAGKRAEQLASASTDASRHGRADPQDREHHLVVGLVGSSGIGKR